MEKSIHSPEYSVFLKLLKEQRHSAGLSQEEIANRLSATQTFISKCERGERRIDVIELHSWCTAMETTMAEFVSKLEKKLDK